jgi:Tfp pilus assembly protein PilE
MGQQQLLLVILVTIIVGIATVVAINTFSSAADSANVDSVRNDMIAIAASAQSHYLKPTMLGGGGRTFNGIGFQDLAFPYNGVSADSLNAQNENGTYTMVVAGDGQSITLTASPASDDSYVPGAIDTDGVLTVGTAAASTISGTIEPDGYVPN